METENHKISELWRREYSSEILQYSRYQITEQFERMAALFAPGESYFYILNMHNLELDYISPSVEKFAGISPENLTMDELLKLALPEEIEKLEKKELVIKDFFCHYLTPSELTKYKIIYSYKMVDHKKRTRVMLMQATPISVSKNNMPMHVFTIHCDITHIAANSTRSVSFVNLQGGKSFYNVPVDKGIFKPTMGSAESDISGSLTTREREIVDLLAQGYGAKQIADHLNLSIHTIHTHRKNVLAKSGCKNTAELIAESMMAGILR
ncbi:helix-turn-helix transcriptional regulator [Salegentibacter sp. F188]|uniref:Helix-turn-helix transcriptional regulator n=1 Tax=Autumnicola patrickiae TaxID=3075591 RepID=A0ABU3E436_9FLAO|nr:helix-turn-helix transcriptional regulator [Salegentibacter sp. F188]MDT0690012.1 helix-turn-helix transcriptional regulator [Salegentibacter sp. F188]